MSRTESYNFTNEFQDLILACLIRHPDEFYALGEIIKPEYFNGPAAIDTTFRLLEYKRLYGSYPSFDVLANFAFTKASRVNVDAAAEAVDYVEKLGGLDTGDRQAVLDLCVQFAKERAIYDALRKIHAAQSEGKGNEVNPIQIMEAAMAVGTDLTDLGLSLYHDYEKIIRDTARSDYGVHTGYPLFDALWKNGWAPGWLIVLLAPPKRYKTGFAINLALNIAKTQDADVLYYACEINQQLAAMRALSSLTGWTQEDFQQNMEKGVLVAGKALKDKLIGNVWFKSYPSKSTTISQIKSHAKQVIKTFNLKPRAIVVDYAETVRPDAVDKKAPDWRQQADIYTQARAMGDDLGCCVIMPDRCNKETVSRSVPSMGSFQGAFEKAGIVDAAIGLCSTDAEYKQRLIRYFVFLNRHGDAYLHYQGKVDPERMQMTVDKAIDYDPEDDEEDDKPFRGKGGSRHNGIKHRTPRGAEETQIDY